MEEVKTEAPAVPETAEEITEASAPEAIEAEPFAEELVSDSAETAAPNEPIVKRCPSCGNIVRPQANFCNQCGYKMK